MMTCSCPIPTDWLRARTSNEKSLVPGDWMTLFADSMLTICYSRQRPFAEIGKFLAGQASSDGCTAVVMAFHKTI